MKKKIKTNEFIASEILLQNLVKKNKSTCKKSMIKHVQQDSVASISAFYTKLVL